MISKKTLFIMIFILYSMFVYADNPYNESLISDTDWFNFGEMNTNTTYGMIFYFILFFIVALMFIVGEVTQIPFLMIVSAVMGFYFGILLTAVISSIIGVLVITLSAMYIIRSLYALK